MANLQETATWEAGIRQLEITDPVIGGPDGIDNIAPRQLANRTSYLKGQVDSLRSGLNQTNNNVTNLGTSKEDKAVVAALAGRVSSVESGKEDKTAVAALAARIAELEKKSAVFAAGGGMVLWQKPANQIPAGWSEVVNWRGRFPMGWDPNQSEFDTIGKIGGDKSKYLSVNEMPSHNHYSVASVNVGGGTADVSSSTTPAREFRDGDFSQNYTIKGTVSTANVGRTSSAGSGNSFSILNPYRVVMFIEYVG